MKKMFYFMLMLVVFLSCGNDKAPLENDDIVETPDGDGSDETGDDANDGDGVHQPVEWYVSPVGDDNGNGTEDKPFKTITFAIQNAQAGDIIYLRGGSYYERVVVGRSGTEDAPITIKGFPGEEAKIDGSKFEFKGSDPLLKIENVDNIIIENIHVCNALKTANMTDPEGIAILGSAKNITIKGCKIYEIKNDCPKDEPGVDWRSAHGILVWGNNNDKPITNLTIEECEIFNIHSGTSETLTLVGNVTDFVVQNNYIHDVENIAIIAACGAFFSPSMDKNVNYARDGVIKGNKVHRASHDVSQDYWQYNPGSNYGAIGIYVCGSSNVIVEQNIVSGCDRGIGLVCENPEFSVKDCIVRNNFVYDSFRTGIYMGDYRDLPTNGTSGCYVLNNTLYANNKMGGALEEDRNTSEGEIRLSKNCHNNTVKNNIIYAVTDRDIFIRKYPDDNSYGNVIDSNCYYSINDNNKRWMWNGIMYTDYNQWKQASGADKNSINDIDPQFVDIQNLDWHLLSNSPVKGKGEYMSSYFVGKYDLDGDLRVNNNKISIGCDE